MPHYHHHPSPSSSSLLTLLALLLTPCAATVTWLYPQSTSHALSYNYNDLVYFTWESNFTNPSLTLWCASGGSYYNLSTTPLVPQNGTSPQSFPYAPTFNETCHMSLYCHDDPSPPPSSSPSSSHSPSPSPSSPQSPSRSIRKCGSDYVGQSAEFGLAHDDRAAAAAVTAAASSTSTSTGTGTGSSSTATGSASGSATATSKASVTETTAAAAVASASITASARTDPLTPAAKAGLGVGAGVGGILVLIAIVIVFFRFHHARRTRRSERLDGFGTAAPRKGVWGNGQVQEMEMEGEGRRGELGGTPRAELSAVGSPVG